MNAQTDNPDYRAIFQRLPNAFAYHKIITDGMNRPVDYRFLEVNAAFERMTGLKRKNLIGKNVTDVLPDIRQDPADWIGLYGQVALTGQERRFEQFSRSLGKYYSVYAFCPRKWYFCVFFDDITHHRQTELDLLESEKRKDDFIGIASHELKTPLTTIKAYAQILERRPGHPDAGRLIRRLNDGVQKMGGLINELLDVSRIQAGKMKLEIGPCPIESLIKDAAEEFRLIHDGCPLDINLKTQATVLCDRPHIQQVLTNLLTNAAKYSNNQPVFLTAESAGGTVTVNIRDSGPGIPPDQLDHIFRKFYRVDGGRVRSPAGLGLGLYISREIIRAHGGDIRVDCRQGKGSTFSFTLRETVPPPSDFT